MVGLFVYSRTLLPGIGFGDWGEMATVPHILGVAHPTGYPTYIVLAWLAELVPIGSIAFRANLLSAVYVSITLATAGLISLRLGVRPVLALAGALALGLIGTVWVAADVSEVNPLHLMLAALVIHRALVWADRRATRDLVLGGLLLGLGLGNHLLMLFIAPFVALFVLWAGRRKLLARPWLLLLAGGAGLLGLSVYLYIPLAALRNPALPYNHPTTLDGVIWLVSGTQFRGQFDFLAARGPGDFMAALPSLWSLLLARATIVVPIVGAIGLVRLVWRRPAFGLMCVAIMVTATYIWANYLELEHYLLVPWLILGIGLSMGLESLARALTWALDRLVGSARSGKPDDVAEHRTGAGIRVGLLGTGVVGLAALAFVVVLGSLNWSANDLSGNDSGTTYVDAVFSALPPNAAILSYWDASTPLWYGQHVEGRRPDVLIVDDTNIVYEGWGTREARIASLICTRPVFILRLSSLDLEPTRQQYQLDPFLAVTVAAGGPVAAATVEIYQVHPLDPATCPSAG
ncbi:MAG: protein O-mannosyl-transferase family [Candidatus Limnocylindrales bacterium]